MKASITSPTYATGDGLYIFAKGSDALDCPIEHSISRNRPYGKQCCLRNQPGIDQVALRVSFMNMRLLDKFKNKTGGHDKASTPAAVIYPSERSCSRGRDLASRLPKSILEVIFQYVCPHAFDLSYRSWEDTAGSSAGCKLCQTQDLASCLKTCRSWRRVVEPILYQSIRIDVSHFCGRTDSIDDRRNRASSFRKSRAAEPENPVQRRFKVFTRTVREESNLGQLVKVLRVPWQIKETARADLARAVSALSRLQYVDLPTGEYENASADVILNEELLYQCLDLRKMRYNKGADQSLRQLSHTTKWSNLEVLELNGLHIEAEALLTVLATFSNLEELSLAHITGVEDSMLTSTSQVSSLPVLLKLSIEGPSPFTVHGLCTYLNGASGTRLTHLSLIDSNIPADSLHQLISAAKCLQKFAFRNDIFTPTSFLSTPLLSSSTLEALDYRILPLSSSNSYILDSHYSYLTRSIMTGSLTRIKTLYVYNDKLPSLLLQPKSEPNDGSNSMYSSRSSSSMASDCALGTSDFQLNLMHPLTIYTKPASAIEQEWSINIIGPNSPKGCSPSGRSLMHYSSITSMAKDNEKPLPNPDRFLAVPSSTSPIPRSPSSGEMKKKSHWRRSASPAKPQGDWMGADY